jgi:TonB dependent receptor/Carboxypeptidase regulatory-like domain
MSGVSISASVRGPVAPLVRSAQGAACAFVAATASLSTLVLVVLLSAASVAAAEDAGGRIVAGTPLTTALLQLQREGLKLVFSSQVVRPEMTVVSTPRSRDPRQVLDEVLAANGLAAADGPDGVLVIVVRPPARLAGLRGFARSPAGTPLAGVSITIPERGVGTTTGIDGSFRIEQLEPGTCRIEARRPGFVPRVHDGVVLQPDRIADVSFVLQPSWVEEIVVQPSRISLLTDQAGTPTHLTREEIETLPHLGDDVFRTLRLLPGTSSSDLSAQLHPRGARRDELLILMDGQEIYDPYHLKEFDNALSIVGSSTLERVSLATAAFPVNQGDRMGGVLDMTTLAASRKRLRLSAGILGVAVEAGNLHRDGTVGWFVAARRGSTDLLGRAFHLEQPAFWDALGKVDLQLDTRQSVQLRTLLARDDLSFTRDTGKRLKTEYDSAYVWAAHRALIGDVLFIDTVASRSHVHRDRRGSESDEERAFDVRDRRHLDVTGLTQSWTLQATTHQLVSAGAEYRHFDAFYDYGGSRNFITPLAVLRSGPRDGTFGFQGRLASDQTSLYLSDRIRPAEALTIELGGRFDHNSLISDHELSPRLNVAWATGESSVIRFGWGRFSQSQRPSELMIEDGDARLYPTERSEHWVLGFERAFSASSPFSTMRLEAYRRSVANPRPRYENLFAVFDPFPEGDFDRVRLEPVSANATGLELTLRGRATARTRWWLNCALASTTDRIAGRTVSRGIDQRHVVNLDVNYHLGRGWNANAAIAFRTGRPVTALNLVKQDHGNGELEVIPVLGPLNRERLPHYQRVDLRLSRDWLTRTGTLRLFLDVNNLLGRQNVAGLDITVDEEDNLRIGREYWPRFIASAGISWELR